LAQDCFSIRPPEVTFGQLSKVLVPQAILALDVSLTPDDTADRRVASVDQRHFAYVSTASNPGVWLVSPDRRQSTKLLSPRAATADQAAENLDLTWSDGCQPFKLVRSQIGDKVWPLGLHRCWVAAPPMDLDRQLLNMTLAASKRFVRLARCYFGLAQKALRRLNVEVQTVSATAREGEQSHLCR